ncbi:MAG: radical SAM protein [Clostridia bacterium]|nr:radical SAM protein [Clostridia bacterium]
MTTKDGFPRLHEDFSFKERMLLLYTNQCTARCAHCAAESTPDKNDKMRVEDAKHYLDVAAAKGFKWILWTGGEVFIYFDEILELTKYGNALGLLFSIDTNAYWALSIDQSAHKLRQLKEAGLIHLDVSCDAFHAPYVPFDRIVNAVKGAQEVGLSVRVCFTYSGDVKKDEDILIKLKENQLPYVDAHLARVGFAKKLPSEKFDTLSIKSVGDCGELGPLVLPDGSLIGCCNPTVKAPSPIFVGSGKEKFEESIDRFLTSPVVDAITHYGFNHFYELLSENPHFQKIKDKNYSHCCEFCEDIFMDPCLRDELIKACKSSQGA